MKLGSLFSGGGLGDFGFMAAGMDIAWQCEIDEYCQKILALRYPESKKYTDIKTLKGAELEPIDILTGGFPCQPFSKAGRQKNKDDNRYLWPEMLRIIKECRPRWVVGENVPGIIHLALETVCVDLESEGYEVWPIVFPSHALGAWHKRDRVWIVAYRNSSSRSSEFRKQQDKWTKEFNTSSSSNVAYSTSKSERNQSEGFSNKPKHGNTKEQQTKKRNRLANSCEILFRRNWLIEPKLGRLVDGCSNRIHRLKMLGNGQTPCSTYVLGKFILDIERQMHEGL